MLNRIARGFLVLAILLATLSMVIAGITLSPSYRDCECQYGERTSPQEQQTSGYPIGVIIYCVPTFGNQNEGAITGFATAILAVVTFGLVWLGIEQAGTTRAQLRA